MQGDLRPPGHCQLQCGTCCGTRRSGAGSCTRGPRTPRPSHGSKSTPRASFACIHTPAWAPLMCPATLYLTTMTLSLWQSYAVQVHSSSADSTSLLCMYCPGMALFGQLESTVMKIVHICLHTNCTWCLQSVTCSTTGCRVENGWHKDRCRAIAMQAKVTRRAHTGVGTQNKLARIPPEA